MPPIPPPRAPTSPTSRVSRVSQKVDDSTAPPVLSTDGSRAAGARAGEKLVGRGGEMAALPLRSVTTTKITAPLSPATPAPLTPTTSLADDETINLILSQHNLALSPKLANLFRQSCEELSRGRITTHEFTGLAKSWVDLGWLTSLHGVVPYIELLDKLQEVARKIERKQQAHALTARYLDGLVTAQNLELESVKVVTVVKEIVEIGFDDHEVTYLAADSCVVRNFIVEEVIPFLARLARFGDASDVPIAQIRNKRAEIKAKLAVQQKNVSVHLQRAESGIAAMANDTYATKANHLPRFAAAAAQEIVLRVYYILLGRCDDEDIMGEADVQNLRRAVGEYVNQLCMLFRKYAEERVKLVSKRYDKRSGHSNSMIVSDAGSPNDVIYRKTDFQAFTTQWPKMGAHENGSAKVKPDGSLKYFDDSWNGRDWTTAPALAAYESLTKKMKSELVMGGPVWKRLFQGYFDHVEHFLRGVLADRDDGRIEEVEYPLLLEDVKHEEKKRAELQLMPLSEWLTNGQQPDALTTEYFYAAEQGSPARKLVAVVCTAMGQVAPGHYDITRSTSAVELEGSIQSPSKHTLEVILQDGPRLGWTKAIPPFFPGEAAPIGQGDDGESFYLGRANFKTKQLSGSFFGTVSKDMARCTSIVYRDKIENGDFEVLCWKGSRY